MKVLYPFAGLGLGGSHVATLALIDGLAPGSDIEPVVVAPGGTAIEDAARARGVGFVDSGETPSDHRPRLSDLAGVPARKRLLSRIIGPGGAGLIHSNDLRAHFMWLGPGVLSGLPVVYHHHSLNVMTPAKRLLISQSDHVITISGVCLSNLDFLPAEKVTVSLNPIAIDPRLSAAACKAKLCEELGLNPEQRLVGFVGNFFERKRPVFFLEACAILAQTHSDCGFVLFGRNGDYAGNELLGRARALGIGDQVRVLGFRLPPEANIAALDLLACPSLNEPFGRTLVEAILAGTPYVASDSGGHREIHDRWAGGQLVQPDAEPKAFAQILAEALDYREQFILSEESKRAIAIEASPARHAAEVNQVYNRLRRDSGLSAPGKAARRASQRQET